MVLGKTYWFQEKPTGKGPLFGNLCLVLLLKHYYPIVGCALCSFEGVKNFITNPLMCDVMIGAKIFTLQMSSLIEKKSTTTERNQEHDSDQTVGSS